MGDLAKFGPCGVAAPRRPACADRSPSMAAVSMAAVSRADRDVDIGLLAAARDAHRPTTSAFSLAMLSCHLVSCVIQLLYHTAQLTAAGCLRGELALLGIKTAFEWRLGALSLDIALHHTIMVAACVAVQLRFAAEAYLVVEMQHIHCPLALQYARRLRGGPSSASAAPAESGQCGLDTTFSRGWLLVVTSRGTLLVVHTLSAIAARSPVVWVLLPLALTVLALDVQWTRETFERRSLPLGASPICAAGVGLGVAAHRSMAISAAAWAVGCAGCSAVAAAALAGARPWARGARPKQR